MNINRVIIFSNGTLDKIFLKNIQPHDFIIGVDKATYWLIQNHIIPHLAIGDFDSTSKKEMTLIRQFCQNIKIFPSQKDLTDTELAVFEAIKLKPQEIIIYGAIGTRIDHTLANILLLEKISKHSITSSIRDLHNEIYLIKKTLILKKNKNFPFVSLLPLTNSAIISLIGFAYDLDRKTIFRDQSLGISNEIIQNPAKIILHQGQAFIIRSKD